MKKNDIRSNGASEVMEVLRAIRRLVGSLQSSARAVERRTGITNAQLFLLRALAERREASLGELAAAAGTQQSTASIVVRRLTRSGLVKRQMSTEDRRRVVLSLTAHGREKLRHAPIPPTSRLLEGLAAIPGKDLRALGQGLRALERYLGSTRASDAGMLFEAPWSDSGAPKE